MNKDIVVCKNYLDIFMDEQTTSTYLHENKEYQQVVGEHWSMRELKLNMRNYHPFIGYRNCIWEEVNCGIQ